jgi:hypothetical protein
MPNLVAGADVGFEAVKELVEASIYVIAIIAMVSGCFAAA